MQENILDGTSLDIIGKWNGFEGIEKKLRVLRDVNAINIKFELLYWLILTKNFQIKFYFNSISLIKKFYSNNSKALTFMRKMI